MFSTNLDFCPSDKNTNKNNTIDLAGDLVRHAINCDNPGNEGRASQSNE